MMRRLSLLLVLSLIKTGAASAADIREFDQSTVARLGREMNRVSQRADKGATDHVRKRAQQTAISLSKAGSLRPATISSLSAIQTAAVFSFAPCPNQVRPMSCSAATGAVLPSAHSCRNDGLTGFTD